VTVAPGMAEAPRVGAPTRVLRLLSVETAYRYDDCDGRSVRSSMVLPLGHGIGPPLVSELF
jgi:hypothetical protein